MSLRVWISVVLTTAFGLALIATTADGFLVLSSGVDSSALRVLAGSAWCSLLIGLIGAGFICAPALVLPAFHARPRFLRFLCAPILMAPLALLTAPAIWDLLSGPTLRRLDDFHRIRMAGLVATWIILWLLALTLWRAMRATTGETGAASRRTQLGLDLAAAAAVAAAIFVDRSVYPGLYSSAHLLLWLFILLVVTIVVAAHRLGRPQQPIHMRGGIFLVGLLVLVVACGFAVAPPRQLMSLRASWFDTVFLRRALEFLAPAPELEDLPVDPALRARIGAASGLSAALLDERIPGRRGLNLILVSFDAMRADRLGRRREGRSITPNVDRLRREGTLFGETWTTAPITFFAFSSLMRGRYPRCTDVYLLKRYREEITPANRQATLAELLAATGRAAVGVVGIHRDHVAMLDRGFDRFSIAHAPAWTLSAEEVTDRAIAELGRLEADPFFLWVHYFDPHAPYEGRGEVSFGVDPEARYDAEIHYADRHLGRLLDDLESRGLLERSMIVFVADHGELWDALGNCVHSTGVTQEEVHVPLIIRVPGLGGGRVVATPASTVDVLPTVLELLGIPVPSGVQGRSLLPDLLDEPASEGGSGHPVLVETEMPSASAVAARIGPLKIVHDRRRGLFALYDLASDPGETEDLSRKRPEDFARMRTVLGTMLSLAKGR